MKFFLSFFRRMTAVKLTSSHEGVWWINQVNLVLRVRTTLQNIKTGKEHKSLNSRFSDAFEYM
jgi:hypothetical protein